MWHKSNYSKKTMSGFIKQNSIYTQIITLYPNHPIIGYAEKCLLYRATMGEYFYALFAPLF